MFLSKLTVQFHASLHARTHPLQAFYPFMLIHLSSPSNPTRAHPHPCVSVGANLRTMCTYVSVHTRMGIRVHVHTRTHTPMRVSTCDGRTGVGVCIYVSPQHILQNRIRCTKPKASLNRMFQKAVIVLRETSLNKFSVPRDL